MEKTAQGKGFRFPFPWEPHPNDLRGHSWLCPLKDPPATGCGRHPGSGYDGGADGAGLRRLDGRRDAVVLCALTSPGHGTPVSVGAGMRNGGLIPSVACGDSSPLTHRGAFFCCKCVAGVRYARIRRCGNAKWRSDPLSRLWRQLPLHKGAKGCSAAFSSAPSSPGHRAAVSVGAAVRTKVLFAYFFFQEKVRWLLFLSEK